jgi:hypothetical protein
MRPLPRASYSMSASQAAHLHQQVSEAELSVELANQAALRG